MTPPSKNRTKLIDSLNDITRESSTYTVLLHQVIADKLSLNITDHKCLDLIERIGSMTAGRLAEITGLTTGAITGVVDRLEKAGYVQRERDPQDRRKVIVKLVPEKAHQDMFPLFEVLRQRHEPVFNNYSDEELKVIYRYMQESNNSIREAITVLREEAGNL